MLLARTLRQVGGRSVLPVLFKRDETSLPSRILALYWSKTGSRNRSAGDARLRSVRCHSGPQTKEGMTRERVETIAGAAAILLFCVFCVYREGVEMIPGMAGILLLGVFYGYLIGRVAKRRSWRGKNVKWVALLPFLSMFAVCLGSRDASHFAEAGQAWMRFWSTRFGFIWF